MMFPFLSSAVLMKLRACSFPRSAVSEKVVGSPCYSDLFEFFTVTFVGRIDDKGPFGRFDDDEVGLFGFGDFFPVDILLMA